MLEWFAGMSDAAWQMARCHLFMTHYIVPVIFGLCSGSIYYAWLKYYEYELGQRMHLGHAFNL